MERAGLLEQSIWWFGWHFAIMELCTEGQRKISCEYSYSKCTRKISLCPRRRPGSRARTLIWYNWVAQTKSWTADCWLILIKDLFLQEVTHCVRTRKLVDYFRQHGLGTVAVLGVKHTVYGSIPKRYEYRNKKNQIPLRNLWFRPCVKVAVLVKQRIWNFHFVFCWKTLVGDREVETFGNFSVSRRNILPQRSTMMHCANLHCNCVETNARNDCFSTFHES